MLDRTKKYATNSGRLVTILKWDANSEDKPIIGIIHGLQDIAGQWSECGRWNLHKPSENDLILILAKTKFYYYTYRLAHDRDELQGPMHTNHDVIKRWHANANVATSSLSEIKEIEL